MAWVKLDDAMPHHPKVMAAGPQAFALDVAGICYSNRFALDGFILDGSLSAVCPSLRNPKRWAQVLVEAGRWTRETNGWRIHDIEEYQPTAAESKEISKKRAAAGRKGGLRSGEARANQNASDTEPTGKQVASTKLNPVPSRPVPSQDNPPNPPKPPGPVVAAERWARRWCEIAGLVPSRSVLKFVIPKVTDFMSAGGEPTEELLQAAHRNGIKTPGGWGFQTNPADDQVPDWLEAHWEGA